MERKPHKFLLISLSILATFYLAFAGYMLIRLKQKGETPGPTNFEECLALTGSSVESTNPPICVTKEGERFTQAQENTPDVSSIEWEIYENKELGIKLNYPEGWESPRTTSGSDSFKVIFNDNLTVERARYRNFSGEGYVSFDDFVNQNTLPESITLDYQVGGSTGKKLIYRSGSKQDILAALPYPNSENEILTFSYSLPEGDLEKLRTINKVLASVSVGEFSGSRVVGAGCKLGGCSSEICQNEEEETAVSICIYKEEFTCYESAACEKQENGGCAWTQTEELKSCLSS